MMAHKFQHDIIAKYLPNKRDLAITARELFDDMCDADKGRFESPTKLSQSLTGIMAKRRIPLANGDSEIVNGKARLTWYLNEKQPAKTIPIEEPMVKQSEAKETPIMLKNQALSPPCQGLTLDPCDEIESALITMANYMRTFREPVKLENKDVKIKLLSLMRDFHGKFNDEVNQVLGDIIEDLDRLEAA